MADFDELANQWVRRTIRAEMVKRGLTYADLARHLTIVGRSEDERVLRNKIARGTFSAAFFAQCLAAMGIKNLQIDLLDYQLNVEEHDAEVAKRYHVAVREPGKES